MARPLQSPCWRMVLAPAQLEPAGSPAAPAASERNRRRNPRSPASLFAAKGGFLGSPGEQQFNWLFTTRRKLPVPPTSLGATARWPVHYSVYDERTILTPTADGMAVGLTSTQSSSAAVLFNWYLNPDREGRPEPPEVTRSIITNSGRR